MDAVATSAVLGISAGSPALGIQTGLPLANAAVANSAIVTNNFLNLSQVGLRQCILCERIWAYSV